MKLVIISDTHSQLSQVKVPDGDILIHCGDWTYLGEQQEIIKFGRDIRKLPHKHKILIPGNHDLTFDPRHPKFHADRLKWLKPDDRTQVVINSTVEVEGLKIFCTSLIPKIGEWAFGYPEMCKKALYDTIEKVDIVISHGPPLGIMDEANYGCPVLLDLVERVKPRFHFFGHCHAGYGKVSTYDTLFINASVCDRAYKPTQKPTVIDI